MRILHIISTTDPKFGGPVESVAQLGTYLRRKGVVAEVLACTDEPGKPRHFAYPLKVHEVGPGLGVYGYSRRLVPWLKQHGGAYDAWVINGIWQYHAAAAASLARSIGKPYLTYTHGMLDPWSRRAHPFKYLKKFVYWTLFERHTLRGARAVCFTAEEEATLARRYFPFGDWTDFVVGAGIAPTLGIGESAIDSLKHEFPELAGKSIWLFLSRIHPKKALDIALKAFARVRAADASLHFLIAGGGHPAYVSRLKALCEKLGIVEHVTFSGPLYGETKWAAYGASDLFVLPSHQENFGIVVAEALAASLPVCISTRINIWREIAQEGAGLICQDELESLEKALRVWQAMTPGARAEMRTNASRCFEEHFHVKSAGDRLFQKLTEITRK